MSLAFDLARELRSYWAPSPEQSVTEVAEAEFYLPAAVSQRSGPYSTDHCRYICEVLEDFNDDGLEDSTTCFAAQVFKSTGMIIGVGFRIARRPTNIIWLMPSFSMAQTFSETKWQPMLEASPALVARMSSDKDKFKRLEQHFQGCILWFVGSGSERNLKSKSAEIIVIDEIDDVEAEWAKRGKSAIGLIDSRRKSYAGSKIFKTGTPQEVNGACWTSFLEGDRRLYFIDCPECRGEFVMEFDPKYIREWFPDVAAGKVVWDEEAKLKDGSWDFERVFRSARMECPHCKARLSQSQIPAMVRHGRWRATNSKALRGKRSRRLPSMYSPHENTAIGKLAVKWLQCQHKPGGVRNFLNEELALPFQPKAATITVSEIQAVVQNSPSYVRGEIPREDIALLSLTVDVNLGLFSWLIRAWFGDYASALVDYGTALSWEGLRAIAEQKYRISRAGPSLSPMFCLIDSGWRTKSEAGVYDFCLKSGGRWRPVKGATKGQGLKRTIEESEQDLKGQTLRLIRFDEPVLKYDLYFGKVKNRDSKWWLPVNIGKDYEAQLTDEYYRETPEGWAWDTREKNNHLGDCEKMQLIIPSLIEGIAGKDGLRGLAAAVARLPKSA